MRQKSCDNLPHSPLAMLNVLEHNKILHLFSGTLVSTWTRSALGEHKAHSPENNIYSFAEPSVHFVHTRHSFSLLHLEWRRPKLLEKEGQLIHTEVTKKSQRKERDFRSPRSQWAYSTCGQRERRSRDTRLVQELRTPAEYRRSREPAEDC